MADMPDLNRQLNELAGPLFGEASMIISRSGLNDLWIEEYRNVPGGVWKGRSTMLTEKNARVLGYEQDLFTLYHDSDGHGPWVINYHVGTRSVNVDNQKLSDAYGGTARTRRCLCGLTDDSDEGVLDVFDETTYDGFTRDLREVPWPGFVWEGAEYPSQPRSTSARRGRRFLVQGDD